MSAPATGVAAAAPAHGLLRLHRALMPDYNRQATVYWWSAVALGTAIVVHSLHTLAAMPSGDALQVGVGVLIAMLAGIFPIRIPHSKNSFAAGEIFVFLLLLLHGPAAATLAAVGEGLVGSWRTSRRWTSRIASPAMASIAMFGIGSLLQAGMAWARSRGIDSAAVLLLATMLSSVLYFLLNTVLITAVPYLKRSQWPTAREIVGSFGWIGVTYAGSASVACLLFLTVEQSGIGVLVAAAPIIGMLLTTLHYFFRQQEVDAQVRRNQLEAIEREAALSAQHLRALEVSERRFHSAFTHASIGMALVAIGGQVLQVNAALRELLGLGAADELENHRFADFVGADDTAALDAHVLQVVSQQATSFAVELRLRHRDDRLVWAAVHGSIFSELGTAMADAAAPCLILQVHDITARRQAESDLHHIAFHDALTGLPNRRRFQQELTRALEGVREAPRRHFGLMFLDYDRFKLINDSLGHAVGDEFLKAVARRIQAQVRPDDIVARLGGDEFAILATDLECERYGMSLADRLLETLRRPFSIAGTEISTSASIGITFSGLGYATPADMLRDADIAMYKAKSGGKDRYALFDSALHTEVSHRLRLEGDLRRALAEGQLAVAYQPLFEMTSGRIIGFEALARWDHPELGSISPSTFIPVAEDAALIVQLTDFVLHSACRELGQWQQRDPRFADLCMHVNVSGNDIAHPGLAARVAGAVQQAGLQPRHLTLELTENILMERLAAGLPTLLELRRRGFGLSVDDFGTGYSSLRHLSSLPVDSLKIDRAFIAELQVGSNEAAVVKAIIQLGNSLGKSIIAEGIETAHQMKQLRRMGCDTCQGFFLSKPLSALQVDRLLEGFVSEGPVVTVAPVARHSGFAGLLH